MPTTDYLAQYKASLDEIDQLEQIPERVKDHALLTLDNALRLKLGNRQAEQALRGGRDALANVSKSSFAANYSVIYTQMCVLAVSSLEAILKSYFEHAVDNYKNLLMPNPRLEKIRITLEDVVASNLRFGGKLGRLILEKEKPTFQDLQSIKTIFKDYFGKEVSLAKEDEKLVIFYLEARHVIVHKGGKADAKFIAAVSKMDANLHDLKEGDKIQLDLGDWRLMRRCFPSLVQAVTAQASTRS